MSPDRIFIDAMTARYNEIGARTDDEKHAAEQACLSRGYHRAGHEAFMVLDPLHTCMDCGREINRSKVTHWWTPEIEQEPS